MDELFTPEEASAFATKHVGKEVTVSNINYLIQYGRIDKMITGRGLCVSKNQLIAYYGSFMGAREIEWKNKLGQDVNWALSFDNYSEAQTTKHVHRLHPYKGKYIPQLVEYFLDDHVDAFKTETYFKPGDIVLDPFCGSGTTLVQANELGMHAVGIDISVFNSQIANCKVQKYDVELIEEKTAKITSLLDSFEKTLNIRPFEGELLQELAEFNNKFFPSPEFKKAVYQKRIDEKVYAEEKEKQFLPVYRSLTEKYSINLNVSNDSFIDKWYFETARKEIYYVNSLISLIDDEIVRRILQVILSRTIRSCRATTHSDLATLIEPVYTTYYCTKHKKICKPLFSIMKWWNTYSKDTVTRLRQFDKIRSDTSQICLTGDSSTINLEKSILSSGGDLADAYRKNKISGIFCSPPYVGLINYHEQHAYAYELFGFKRRDELEIGSMSKGNNRIAVQKYIDDMTGVLLNCKQYLKDDYNIFIVANDKHNVYPIIAERSGMRIVEQFKRPVLNRTEKDKNAYSEIIFRMKEKNDE
jgi:hypothetical protein